MQDIKSHALPALRQAEPALYAGSHVLKEGCCMPVSPCVDTAFVFVWFCTFLWLFEESWTR